MNNKSKIAIATALGLGLLAVGGGVALARPDGAHGGHGGFPGMMMMRLFSDLDLTEQQELKAIRMRRDLMKQGQEAKKESFEQMGTAIEELGKASPDPAKLHGVADQAIQRFAKLVHSAIDQALQLHATLTPEQRNTLVTHAREMHQKREERMERFDRAEQPQLREERKVPQKTK